MIDIRAVTCVFIKNSVRIMDLIIALKIEEFYFFLTHCTKLTKNHENKFASSIKMFFPNTCKTVCVKAINLQWKYTHFIYFNFVPLIVELPFCVLVVGLHHVFRWRKLLELVVSAVFAALGTPPAVDKIVATSFSGDLQTQKGFPRQNYPVGWTLVFRPPLICV